MELVGSTAIVTGGSKGIGYAVAGALMAHGADVVITSRHDKEVAEAAATLEAAHQGRRVLPVAADVTSAADVERLYARAEAELAPAAIVVNNAGIHSYETIAHLSEDDWNGVVDSHLKGTFLGTKAALAHMRASGTAGAIINLGAVDAVATTRGTAHYAAAKAGIAKFTEVAALEAGRHGIRVNTVSPGVILTPENAGTFSPDFEAAWHRSFAIDRMGEPADVAKAVVFLASDYAGWITGINLLVDGGTHLRGLPDYVDYLLGGNE
ncbi:SDR family NAD(P)-dependent oxidoreductase [Arthrobacter sp. 08Y14]|uniref:SDR family NAD(P)-dependent oxidoreductase n=1 Tax=Arthrobacter sp. 08Y14 TaxID=2058885 RepID=UPI000CE3410B|nr:SDR family NAD(P)-dependent oxidoreductase [Arthrobacter sp. 08Y14]